MYILLTYMALPQAHDDMPHRLELDGILMFVPFQVHYTIFPRARAHLHPCNGLQRKHRYNTSCSFMLPSTYRRLGSYRVSYMDFGHMDLLKRVCEVEISTSKDGQNSAVEDEIPFLQS